MNDRKQLTPSERLFVALDFKPDNTGRQGTHAKIMALVKKLRGTGIGVKLNADLRVWGEGLIDEVHAEGLRVFADLKLVDIKGTLDRDGDYLSAYRPDILTVMCAASSAALKGIADKLPDTAIIGVTVLTDIPESEVKELYHCEVGEQAVRFAMQASRAGLNGLVCSPHEATRLRAFFPAMVLVCPGIRDPDMPVKKDDQQRTMTPTEALAAGADCLVVGRPIVEAADPYAAAMRFVELIDKATA